MSQNLDLTIEKFTKASAYEMLTNLGNSLAQMSVISVFCRMLVFHYFKK